MTIKEIVVSYELKKSDGNFGSVGSSRFITAELGPEDSVEEVSKALFETCKREVEKTWLDKMVSKGSTPKVLPPVGPKKNNPLDYKSMPKDSEGNYIVPTSNARYEGETPATLDAIYGPGTGPKGSSFEDGESVSGQQ